MEYWKSFSSVPGTRRCMKCGQEFESPDKARIRRCPDCKRNEGPAGPQVYSIGRHGLQGKPPGKGDGS